MKNILLFIILGMSLMSTTYAMKLKSIYGTEVLVSVQDAQPGKQALQQAFAQTLTKVSGTSSILQNAVIKAAMPQAQENVQEFSYAPSGDPSAPFLLRVKFDPQAIKQLLRQAKAPIWDENRPLILVWLSIDEANHTVELIDNGSTHEVAALLKRRAEQRGLPLLFPMMDVTDLNQVTAEEVSTMAIPAIQKASLRYHADGILIGNIQHHDKTTESHWRLILGKNQMEWSFNDSLAPVIVEELINKMVNILGQRYAAMPSSDSRTSLTMVVKGVSQQEDLQHLMRLMKHMPLIKELEVENIAGDEVIMHLAVEGTQQIFIQDVSVEQHLHLELEEGKELTYRWVQ